VYATDSGPVTLDMAELSDTTVVDSESCRQLDAPTVEYDATATESVCAFRPSDCDELYCVSPARSGPHSSTALP
jgi:hypothetical protein